MSNNYGKFDDLPFMLSVGNLSTVLNISKSNAYVVMNRADFPSIRIGRRLLVNKVNLVNWINSQEK
jgi:predicted DNA-binding transcriptional regulator AlpA